MASIAINGLGRVGRAALKIIEDLDGADVVAVNDLIPPDNPVRVPIPVGSIADVVAVTARPVTREEVNGAFREEAASDRYRGILGVAEDPVVSADITGDPRSSVVDVAMTRVVDGTLVKVMSWYDNEWGFACQMIREAFAALGLAVPDLSQVRP